ncbi:MAG: TraR/DksA family transcriptional regulator [Cellvibrionaceae bacterium]
MDVADQAQIEQERALEQALSNRKRSPDTESSDCCFECGHEIPSARQIAVPGVETCVDCQELVEAGLV